MTDLTTWPLDKLLTSYRLIQSTDPRCAQYRAEIERRCAPTPEAVGARTKTIREMVAASGTRLSMRGEPRLEALIDVLDSIFPPASGEGT